MNQHMNHYIPMFAIVCGALLFGVFPLTLLYRKYIGLGREGSYLMSVGTLFAAIATGIYVANSSARLYDGDDAKGFFAGLAVFTGVPLMTKLYCCWTGAPISEMEKTGGLRAWLRPMSLMLAAGVSIGAAKGLDCSFFGVLLVAIGALAAYPLLNRPDNSAPASQPFVENLAVEREKIISMLEAGKITAEESAELLNALGSTVHSTTKESVTVTPRRRLVMIGAALVLVGFLLPWLTINPGAELNRLTQALSSGIGNQFPQMQAMQSAVNGQIANGAGNFGMENLSVSIAGGDVAHGIGWVILFAAAGTALLPFVATQLEAGSLRTVSLVLLGAGSVLLLYIVSQDFRFLSFGFFLVAAGYAAEWIGLLQQQGATGLLPRTARPSSQAGAN
jgi:hypothetical protein